MTTVDLAVNGIQGLMRYDTDNPNGAAHQSELGQKDFLTLMTEQLKNQDPFAPMESGEFLGQMAQFSTVSGIEALNASVASMVDSFASQRLMSAANLVGKEALVAMDVTRANAQGQIAGRIALDEPADRVTLTYSNARTGEVLGKETINNVTGSHQEFAWDVAPQSLREGRDLIRVSAMVYRGESAVSVGPELFARIESLDLSTANGGLNLKVEDYGQLNEAQLTLVR